MHDNDILFNLISKLTICHVLPPQGEEHEPRGPGPAAPRLKDVSVRLLRPDVLLSDRLVPPLLSALAEPPSGPPPSPVLTPGEAQSKLDKWRKRAPRAPLSASLSFSELALTSVHGARRLATRLGSCRLEASCAPRLADAAASLKLEELSVEADDATRIASLASLQVGRDSGDQHVMCSARLLRD